MDPLYLIDGTLYFFRAYFGVPDLFVDRKGRSINGVYGYLQFLLRLLVERKARYAAVAFDESLTTSFRNDFYPRYKANRARADTNIKFQIGVCQKLTKQLGVLEVSHPRFEADDLIATMAGRARRPVVLVSRDKDLRQLLKASVTLIDPASDALWDVPTFERAYGFSPGLFADYQALVGDSVDNIPGVPGIGPKTATDLIRNFGKLEHLYRRVDEWRANGLGPKACERLATHKADAFMMRRLTRLHRQAEVRYPSSTLKVRPPEIAEMRRVLVPHALEQRLQKLLEGYGG